MTKQHRESGVKIDCNQEILQMYVSLADAAQCFRGNAQVARDMVLGKPVDPMGIFFQNAAVFLVRGVGTHIAQQVFEPSHGAAAIFNLIQRIIREVPGGIFPTLSVERKQLAVFERLHAHGRRNLVDKAVHFAAPPAFFRKKDVPLDAFRRTLELPQGALHNKCQAPDHVAFLKKHLVFL